MRPGVRAIRWALAGVAVSLGAGGWVWSQSRDELVEGKLQIQVRGSGAAPFGIASGILTSSNTGLNLGRLQEGKGLEGLASGDGVLVDEVYKALVQFRLKPAGRNKLELHEARITYVLACNTTIEYEGDSSIRDHMRDAGSALWRDGVWIVKPPKWVPGSDPRMDVTLVPDGHGRGRFEMDYSVVHPLTVSGESTWKTPVSEIRLEATEGIVTYHADTPFLNIEAPSGAEGFKELMEGMRSFFDSLPMLDVDTRMDFGEDQKIDGTYSEEDGILIAADTYRNLTGAQVAVFVTTGSFAPVLEPVNRDWLPEPDKEGVTVRARVRGQKAPAVKWRFTLYEVTNEKGQCTNCPISGSDPWIPDLELDVSGSPFGAPEQLGPRSWRVETREPEREVHVQVNATDSGAWGRLKAEYLADDQWIVAQVETDLAGGGALDSITIPVDEQGGSNYIADSWEEREDLVPGASRRADDDNEPESEYKGDGLSAYEEYRGFHEAGNLVRTRPKEKDLFFYVEDGLDSKVRAAVEPTGLRVHLVQEDEMGDRTQRIINDNSGGYRRTVQHGLYVAARRLGGNSLGRACSSEADCECQRRRNDVKYGPTPCDRSSLPKVCTRKSGAGQSTPKDTAIVAVDSTVMGRSSPDYLLEVLGHEVMHGVSVEHHGDGDLTLCARGKGDSAEVTLANDECKCLEAGLGVAHSFMPQGTGSGDLQCIMNYANKAAHNFTIFGPVPAAWTSRSSLPKMQTGGRKVGHLCGNPFGTGANAGGQVGDAKRGFGGCKKQVQVSDEGAR